ncbi:hypothetical protein ACIBCA_19430 [Kitasatospora sp. NPDC051170]|uniref:hypothetical protein n=1 Tax=Kitasatospora sp. NPDC051170 TaxID=3364056 RepID=UPI0037A173A1
MEARTFAVDPEPSGWPWETVGPEGAAAHQPYVPSGPPGAVLMAPGDTRNTALIPAAVDVCRPPGRRLAGSHWPARVSPRARARRDDPLPLRPYGLFEPQYRLTAGRLARMPAVREPWLRGIHDRLRAPR